MLKVDRYILSNMQAESIKVFSMPYTPDMKAGHPVRSKRSNFGERLRSLREAAGLSQRQVAVQLGISQPSYALWELHDVALRPDQLTRLAAILRVEVDDFFDPTRIRHQGGPMGKMRKLFEAASRLPRSQQQKITAVLEAFVNQHASGKAA